jgi:ribosomal protein L28
MPVLAPPIGIRCRAKRRRSIVNVQHPHVYVFPEAAARSILVAPAALRRVESSGTQPRA